jgi:rubredoxin---NAD+ reductase
MATPLRRYLCQVCGFIYDERLGWPEEGILPGTRWSQVPEDWCCPECGMHKKQFSMVLCTVDD